MGEALLSRLVVQQVYLPSDMVVSEPQVKRQEFLAQQYGVQVTGENHVAASAIEVLFLAIKPQVFEQVAADLATHDRHLIHLSDLHSGRNAP